MKRLFDIFVSLWAIIILFPMLAPVMIALRFTGEGYVFYRQKRVGKSGELFDLLKFATMLKDSPNMAGGDITSGNDPRVLPMGRFLRKTKINEIPQLFNILKGDISLVGPRPLTPRNFDYYPDDAKAAIKSLTPGLTGVGSIVFRDEESIIAASDLEPHECYKKIISPYKGKLELWYKEHQNFWLDLKLIFLTAWVVVFPKSTAIDRILKNLPQKPDTIK